MLITQKLHYFYKSSILNENLQKNLLDGIKIPTNNILYIKFNNQRNF